MRISGKLDRLLSEAKANRWLRYFTIFLRLALAFGFFTAGMVKIMGERFAAGLSVNHPMGHYLEALHVTGFYYAFIGVAQITAAILLLVPRTATLGALLYFPIIFNICVLSLAVRFEGSLITSPLMVLANMYLLCWDYDKLKHIIARRENFNGPSAKPVFSNRFPWAFFVGIAAVIVLVVLLVTNVYDIMPRNNLRDCRAQCTESKDPHACEVFCDCIHNKGLPLENSLEQYHHLLKATQTKSNAPPEGSNQNNLIVVLSAWTIISSAVHFPYMLNCCNCTGRASGWRTGLPVLPTVSGSWKGR